MSESGIYLMHCFFSVDVYGGFVTTVKTPGLGLFVYTLLVMYSLRAMCLSGI